MRLTEINHRWLQEVLQHGDIVVDATLGNGFDALFLAQHIGASGQLYGFDVQAQAISQSQQRLLHMPCKQTFYLQGHQHLANTLPAHTQQQVQVIMFNLGWLPNSDKSIITHADTTISALQQALSWLATGGRLSLMLYPGHAGGDHEAATVFAWLDQYCAAMPSIFQLQKVEVPNRPTAPILLQLEKLRSEQNMNTG